MLSVSEAQLLFAGLAALFAFLSVLVGVLKWRWDAADSELERERKLERRFVGESVSVDYDHQEMPDRDARMLESALDVPTGSMGEMGGLFDDPHYEFELVDIVVSERSGIGYGLSKLTSGFQGTSKLTIASYEVGPMSVGGTSQFPPDIEQVSGLDMETEIDYEECIIHVQADRADEQGVEEAIQQVLSYLESELGEVLVEWGYPGSRETS